MKKTVLIISLASILALPDYAIAYSRWFWLYNNSAEETMNIQRIGVITNTTMGGQHGNWYCQIGTGNRPENPSIFTIPPLESAACQLTTTSEQVNEAFEFTFQGPSSRLPANESSIAKYEVYCGNSDAPYYCYDGVPTQMIFHNNDALYNFYMSASNDSSIITYQWNYCPDISTVSRMINDNFSTGQCPSTNFSESSFTDKNNLQWNVMCSNNLPTANKTPLTMFSGASISVIRSDASGNIHTGITKCTYSNDASNFSVIIVNTNNKLLLPSQNSSNWSSYTGADSLSGYAKCGSGNNVNNKQCQWLYAIESY